MASFVKPSKGRELRSGLSKWELEELTKERRKTLGKHELYREIVADGLRCPLCFCLPCAIIAFILLILMGLYIVHPYQVGKSLIQTKCHYNRTEYHPNWSGYCSHRTNIFKPCYKFFVNYNTASGAKVEAVLLENEQALVYCNKCSFTQGRSGLFNKRTICAWNKDTERTKCFGHYRQLFASPNATYPCYYDPKDPQNVISLKQISGGEAALAILIPSILLLIWLVALGVLIYDRYRRRILDGQILVQRKEESTMNGNIEPEKPKKRKSRFKNITISFGGGSTKGDTTNTVTEEISPATPQPQTSSPKRKRKKKLPCCKPHFQFNYLDEGVILEDKPISPTRDQPLNFNYLTIESTPHCNCHHLDSIDDVPDLDLHHHMPSDTTPYYGASPKKAGTILKYLPESFV